MTGAAGVRTHVEPSVRVVSTGDRSRPHATAPGTSASRDVFLDAVRAVAVVRVVTWHTFGWAPITWVVAAVPAMFFVSGHLLARSFARRSPSVVVRDRLRRLLVPFWVFGAVVWVAMALARVLEGTPETALPWRGLVWWVLPFDDPHGSVWEGGWLAQPLWYVRCLLWLLLAAPVLAAVVRRGRTPTASLVVALVAATVALDALHRGAIFSSAWAYDLVWRAGDLTLYATFLTLGLAHARDERALTRARARRVFFAVALACVPLAVAVALVTRPPGWVVNDSHLLHLVVGAGWLALALALRPLVTAAAARPAPHGLVRAIGRRSLTVYLWHTSAVITTWHLLDRVRPLPRGVHSLALGAGTAAGTVALAGLFGAVEDLAARRPARAPRWRRSGVGGVALAGVVVFALAALVVVPDALDRTGSGPAARAAAATPAGAGLGLVAATAPGDAAAPATTADRSPRVPSRAPRPPAASSAGSTSAGSSSGSSGARSSSASPAGGDAPRSEPVPPPTRGDTLEDRLQGVLDDWQGAHRSAGLRAGVARPGAFEWTGATGGASASGRFDIESITKTVTASATWLLVDEGRLRLDAPIPELPGLPELVPLGLTVRQLLEHRTGIPDYHDTQPADDDDPVVAVVRGALAADQEFAPGGGQDYSSTNYLVLGRVLEQVTGASIDDLLWGRVLDPAGLGGRFGRAGADVSLPGGGAGGLVTDLSGLLAWGTALLRDHAVVGPLWSRMAALDPASGIGAGVLGQCPCEAGRWRWIGHTGGTTALFYDAADDLVVALRLANGIWGGYEDAVAELFESLRTVAAGG